MVVCFGVLASSSLLQDVPLSSRNFTTHMWVYISKMKSLARSYVLWPSLDGDIERIIRLCTPCQTRRNVPAVAPLHPWEWLNCSWARLHIDYAGPFFRKMFLCSLIHIPSGWKSRHFLLPPLFTRYFCHSWSTREDRVWQWQCLHKWWVSFLSKGGWYLSHY